MKGPNFWDLIYLKYTLHFNSLVRPLLGRTKSPDLADSADHHGFNGIYRSSMLGKHEYSPCTFTAEIIIAIHTGIPCIVYPSWHYTLHNNKYTDDSRIQSPSRSTATQSIKQCIIWIKMTTSTIRSRWKVCAFVSISFWMTHTNIRHKLQDFNDAHGGTPRTDNGIVAVIVNCMQMDNEME